MAMVAKQTPAGRTPTFRKVWCNMLSWALTFVVIALLAVMLGAGGVAGMALTIAKVLFFVFLVLLVLSLVMPRIRKV